MADKQKERLEEILSRQVRKMIDWPYLSGRAGIPREIRSAAPRLTALY